MSNTRTLKVTIEKEIKIELTDSMFGGMSHDEYVAEFKAGLWDIDGIDDIFKYAAEMAAMYGSGHDHDGLGLLSTSHSTYPRIPDVKFDELGLYVDIEFLD